jgi:hypothetical protein
MNQNVSRSDAADKEVVEAGQELDCGAESDVVTRGRLLSQR